MDWILAKLPLTIRVLSRLKRTLLTLSDCRSNTWTTPSNPNQQHGQQNSHHISPDSDTSPQSAHPSPGVQITGGNTVMVSHKTSRCGRFARAVRQSWTISKSFDIAVPNQEAGLLEVGQA